MDPINKKPSHVSINIPAPWIRHGIWKKYIPNHQPEIHMKSIGPSPPSPAVLQTRKRCAEKRSSRKSLSDGEPPFQILQMLGCWSNQYVYI